MVPDATGSQLDPLFLSRRGVGVFDRNRDLKESRLSPLWAVIGGVLFVLLMMGIWVAFFR